MMRSKRTHLSYALGTLVMGGALLLAGPMGALAANSEDSQAQSHLKPWSNIIHAAKRFVVLTASENAAVFDGERDWPQRSRRIPAHPSLT